MFRTSEGRARYFAAYDATLALWPVPVESFDVSTHFGSTHVHACGPQDAPPLLLLPGQAVSSTMWYPNVSALSQTYRVYAPDIIGDMGKSVRAHPFTQPADFGDWLTELLSGLGIQKTYVAGLSYGGFIALRLALAAPERVQKLILMAPASLLRIPTRYFFRMAAVFLPSFLLSFESKQRLLLGTASPAAVQAIKQMMTKTDFRYSMYLPPVSTDHELRQINASTLLLAGDHEVIYDPKALFKRATSLIPHIETSLIPGAGHALSLDQPDIVNKRILEFLQASD